MFLRKISILLILISLSLLISQLPAQEPQPDAVYLKIVKDYQLKEDGTVVYKYSHQLQYLTYFAFSSRYGETFIIYNPQFQTLKVKRNETTMANGQKIVAPTNAYNEVLPGYAANAPAFNHLREMVVTHTGLERGAMVDLEYEIETKANFYPGFMSDELLAADSPVKELLARIRIPQDKTLSHHLFNIPGQPDEHLDGGEKIFEWTFKNLPAITPERSQPPSADFAPRLVFSAIADWNEGFAAVQHACISENSQDKVLKDAVAKVRAEAVSDLEFVLKIQSMIANDITAFQIPITAIGLRFRPPCAVWKSNGGTLLEKAMLFKELLQLGGLDAQLVLLSDYTVVAQKFPVIQSFNSALVRVNLGGGQFLLLPVDRVPEQNLHYTLAKQWALVIADGNVKLEELSRFEPQENRCFLTGTFSMENENQISGKVNLGLFGASNPYLTFVNRKQTAQKYLTMALSGAEFGDAQILRANEGGLEAQGNFTMKSPFKAQDNYLFWQIAENQRGIANWHLPSFAVQRGTPVKLPFPLIDATQLTLTLPDKMELVSSEAQIQKQNGVGSLVIQISKEGKNVLITRRIEFNKHYVTVQEYPQFLELWRLWQSATYRELVFKKM